MIHEKTFVIDLDAGSATSTAAHTEKAALMRIRNVVNTCYQDTYVLRIAGVENYSRVKFANAADGAYVSVKFRAVCQTVGRDDILVGVRIAARAEAIIGEYDGGEAGKAVVVLEASAAAAVVTAGMSVPVRVIFAQYDRQNMFQVYGRVLTCDSAPLTFHVSSAPFTFEELGTIRLLRDEVIGEYERRRRLGRPDDVRFFETLLYAYRTPGDAKLERASGWAGPARVGADSGPAARTDLVAATEALTRDSAAALAGTWTRPLGEYRSSPFAARAPLARGVPTVRPGEALAKLLANVHAWAKTVNDLVEAYGDALDDHKPLWRAMRDAQAPAPGD